MSKRLASFNGPSTPTASPAQSRRQPTPSSPSRSTESTFHRKVRTLMQELRSTTRTWDDLVRMDGLKAATALINSRTELVNSLSSIPDNTQPRAAIVGPKLDVMEKAIEELDTVMAKMKRQFFKMNAIMDNLEELLTEAHKLRGWSWVHEEALWCTWTLEKFVTSMPKLLKPYHRSLHFQSSLVEKFRNHNLKFEESQALANSWIAQPYLHEDPWVSDWEEICEVEIERWNAR